MRGLPGSSIIPTTSKKKTTTPKCAIRGCLATGQPVGGRADWRPYVLCEEHAPDHFMEGIYHLANVSGQGLAHRPQYLPVYRQQVLKLKRECRQRQIQAILDASALQPLLGNKRNGKQRDGESQTCTKVIVKYGDLDARERNQAQCTRQVRHTMPQGLNGGPYCPMHLRAALLRHLSCTVRDSQWQQELNDVESRRTTEEQLCTRCRFHDSVAGFWCGARVHTYVHLHFCAKHLGTPQGMLVALCRWHILDASACFGLQPSMSRPVRELIASYI